MAVIDGPDSKIEWPLNAGNQPRPTQHTPHIQQRETRAHQHTQHTQTTLTILTPHHTTPHHTSTQHNRTSHKRPHSSSQLKRTHSPQHPHLFHRSQLSLTFVSLRSSFVPLACPISNPLLPVSPLLSHDELSQQEVQQQQQQEGCEQEGQHYEEGERLQGVLCLLSRLVVVVVVHVLL